ncbi:MAG: hypothetical protein ABSA26_01705 [Thermoguttaceae bacterium]|jgi:hypothetical protein
MYNEPVGVAVSLPTQQFHPRPFKRAANNTAFDYLLATPIISKTVFWASDWGLGIGNRGGQFTAHLCINIRNICWKQENLFTRVFIFRPSLTYRLTKPLAIAKTAKTTQNT